LGECNPGRTEEQVQGSEILQPIGQQHELCVQSADVSALLCALPQPNVSPASQQSPWFTELRKSAVVSQLPSWISKCIILEFIPSPILFFLPPLMEEFQQVSLSIIIHVCTGFVPYSPSHTLSLPPPFSLLPLVPTPPAGPILPSCSLSL
jgi:hypothetical protein